MTDKHDFNRREFLRCLLALPAAGVALTLNGCGAQVTAPAAATAAPAAPAQATSAPTNTPPAATATATAAPASTARPPRRLQRTGRGSSPQAREPVHRRMTNDISADGLMKIYEALANADKVEP